MRNRGFPSITTSCAWILWRKITALFYTKEIKLCLLLFRLWYNFALLLCSAFFCNQNAKTGKDKGGFFEKQRLDAKNLVKRSENCIFRTYLSVYGYQKE